MQQISQIAVETSHFNKLTIASVVTNDVTSPGEVVTNSHDDTGHLGTLDRSSPHGGGTIRDPAIVATLWLRHERLSIASPCFLRLAE